MKKITILAGNLRGNLGDYAILHSMVIMLNDLYKPLEITITYHSYTGIDKIRTEKFESMLPSNCKISNATPYYRPKLLTKLLRKVTKSEKMISKVLYYYVCSMLFISRTFKNIKKDSDMIILAGGGHFSDMLLSANMFAQLKISLMSCKNTIVFPQSIPKNLFEFFPKQIMVQLYKQMGIVAFREMQSYQYFKETNLNNIYYFPDIVFALQDKFNLEQVNTISKKSIGIVLANTGQRVGKDYINNKLSVLCKQIELLGYTPIIVTTTESIDIAYLNGLKKLYPNLKIIAPKDWKELIQVFSTMKLIITNRFHGMVFSILSHIPVLPVIDVTKTEYMTKTLGYKYFVNDEDEIDKDYLNNLLNNNLEDIINLQDNYLKSTYNDIENFKIILRNLDKGDK
jgi:polysaccharide pyruvyl transferase WcaK-like protein